MRTTNVEVLLCLLCYLQIANNPVGLQLLRNNTNVSLPSRKTLRIKNPDIFPFGCYKFYCLPQFLLLFVIILFKRVFVSDKGVEYHVLRTSKENSIVFSSMIDY